MADEKKQGPAQTTPAQTSQLEAAIAALQRRITELESRPTGQPGAPGMAPAAGYSEADRKKIAHMKSKARKEDGHHLYRVGKQGHYRDGRLYADGEIVRVPEDQDPSITFTPVTSKEEAKDLPPRTKVTPSQDAPPSPTEAEDFSPPTGGSGKPSDSESGKSSKRAADREV